MTGRAQETSSIFLPLPSTLWTLRVPPNTRSTRQASPPPADPRLCGGTGEAWRSSLGPPSTRRSVSA
jgi:hypothetical protein